MEYILLFLGWICAIIGYYFTRTGEMQMLDIIVSIATAAAAIIAPVIAIITMNRKTNDKIENLQHTMGTLPNRTIAGNLEDAKNQIKNDIGVSLQDGNLTVQHKVMHTMLEKEIETAERRYTEEERRLQHFTVEQHDMAAKIGEFQLFLESWKRMAAENHALQIRITQLELENASLRKKSRNRDVPEI